MYSLSAKNKVKKVAGFDVINVTILLMLSIVTIFPFYYVFIISIADYASMSKQAVYIFPTIINFDAYKIVFKTDYIINGFFISVFTTLAGTAISMIISLAAAYALTKYKMPGRKIIFSYIIITMFVSSGMIPYYLTIKAVHLVNNILVLMLPMAVNTFYLILIKNYLDTVPPSLEESAKIDGANDMVILWNIVLPTCTPIIATISLFYAVERWNEWYHAMLFLTLPELQPLQMALRTVLMEFDTVNSIAQEMRQREAYVYSQSVKMAVLIIATVPIMVVYPFLQKHFTRGILIGSIKE